MPGTILAHCGNMESQRADSPEPEPARRSDAEIRQIAEQLVRESGASSAPRPSNSVSAAQHELSPADEERVEEALVALGAIDPESTLRAEREAIADPTPNRSRAGPEPTSASSAEHPREQAQPTAAHGQALKFIGRLALLDHGGVTSSIRSWHALMRHESEAWFTAEEAVARAVVDSGRHGMQQPLLMHVAEAFAYRVWYRGQPDPASGAAAPGAPAPELRVQATEASGQYVATVAMLALLVRDHLDASTFALLYRPFADLIPVAELVRE